MRLNPVKDKTLAKLVCRYFAEEKPEFNSCFCEKFDQWVSPKYCYFCRFNEPVSTTQQQRYSKYVNTVTATLNETYDNAETLVSVL